VFVVYKFVVLQILVLMYGYETWATTRYLCAQLGAFDTWAFRKILRIPYTSHVTNAEVVAVFMLILPLLQTFVCTTVLLENPFLATCTKLNYC